MADHFFVNSDFARQFQSLLNQEAQNIVDEVKRRRPLDYTDFVHFDEPETLDMRKQDNGVWAVWIDDHKGNK